MVLYGAKVLGKVLTSLVLTSVIVGSNCDGEVENLPLCDSNFEDPRKNLLFVSTLDGQITALDSKDGSSQWNIQAGGPLLSSSIHRLELNNGGRWVRLVPALGGSLYRFSGDSLEPLPLSADQLLSSSHKYSDDLVIAGGKETASLGVSVQSGKVVYECSLSGCINSTSWSDGQDQIQEDPGDLLLIRRVTQTVRAIEPRSGEERWNFSVGQHEISMQPFKGCVVPTPSLKNDNAELIYKVVVPEGLVCAVQKNAPHNIVWKHKLNTPIVSAWNIKENRLHEIDMFGAAFIPPPFSSPSNTADSPFTSPPNFSQFVDPSVYIGMYDRQLYIQESVKMQALVQSHATSRPAIGHGHNHHTSALIIPWKPVPARSPPDWDSGEHTALAQGEYATTALSVLYASEYVNGNGYYLFSDHDRKMLDDPVCDKINTSLATTEKEDSVQQLVDGSFYDEGFEWADDEPIRVFVVSLWYWWKEVTVIALSTAIFLNFVSNRFRSKFSRPEVHKHIVVFQQTIPTVQPSTSSVSSQESTPSLFVSRYLDDFTPVQCLGRGGFGIVFEAKNKIDDCSYAVKRITLPYRKDKRDKVLREVRALAKLEHSHIVRYFNAWLEEPPPGWQDPFEKELKSKLDFTETYSKLPSVSHPNKSVLYDHKKNNICLNIQPEMSTNGHCDSACDKYKTPDFNRQRSYSMNDSFSIVFEKSFKRDNSNSENSEKSFSKCGIVFSLHNNTDDDEDSFAVFEEPKNSVHRTRSGDSVISISDSDFQIKHREGSKSKNMNDTQVVCIEETHEQKRLKRGHRKNLSLDLENISKRRMEPLGQMYLYIQMQLCKQESLRDWLRENMSPDIRKAEVVTIFEQIVDAVEYVHLQGLIHRDLKPSNIFFAVDGRVKIGDFGLVTAMVDSTDQCRSPVLGMPDIANYKHTQHVGTHLYMSPEQLRGEAHGYKVDIWSLGLVLTELLIPFSTEMERVIALRSIRDHKFPQDFVQNYPQEHSLLLLMLSMDPSRRPSTLGVRARAPLLHLTDPRYHFSLPPRSTHHSFSA